MWAAGNGGLYGDTCSTDGYASSIYTITVGSVEQTGKQTDYDENCPAKMVVTFHHHKHQRIGGSKLQTVSIEAEHLLYLPSH